MRATILRFGAFGLPPMVALAFVLAGASRREVSAAPAPAPPTICWQTFSRECPDCEGQSGLFCEIDCTGPYIECQATIVNCAPPYEERQCSSAVATGGTSCPSCD